MGSVNSTAAFTAGANATVNGYVTAVSTVTLGAGCTMTDDQFTPEPLLPVVMVPRSMDRFQPKRPLPVGRIAQSVGTSRLVLISPVGRIA